MALVLQKTVYIQQCITHLICWLFFHWKNLFIPLLKTKKIISFFPDLTKNTCLHARYSCQGHGCEDNKSGVSTTGNLIWSMWVILSTRGGRTCENAGMSSHMNHLEDPHTRRTHMTVASCSKMGGLTNRCDTERLPAQRDLTSFHEQKSTGQTPFLVVMVTKGRLAICPAGCRKVFSHSLAWGLLSARQETRCVNCIVEFKFIFHFL